MLRVSQGTTKRYRQKTQQQAGCDSRLENLERVWTRDCLQKRVTLCFCRICTGWGSKQEFFFLNSLFNRVGCCSQLLHGCVESCGLSHDVVCDISLVWFEVDKINLVDGGS